MPVEKSVGIPDTNLSLGSLVMKSWPLTPLSETSAMFGAEGGVASRMETASCCDTGALSGRERSTTVTVTSNCDFTIALSVTPARR